MQPMMRDRLELAIIGGLAGLSLWGFFEFLPDMLGEGWGLHFAVTLVMAFFATLMALVGPEKPQRALVPSAVLSLVAATLALMGAFRYSTPSDFFGAEHAVVALCVFIFIAIPFAAAELDEKGGWRHYTRLFDTSWGVFIRYFAGWLFAGLILLVLYLSDELLKLVGIRIIEDILEIDAVRYTIIGSVFGLGVATVYELRDYVSPVIVHRLLRMLVPLVLVVVVVFIAALPFRGLSGLFGQLSTAAVLMSVSFAAISLITTLIDRDEDSASSVPLMVLAARALALLLPVLVGLAIYAIWLRVAAYGWTPNRVAAAFVALFLTGYAMNYAYAVLRRASWQTRLRQSNIYLAISVCLGAALWLTPLINAESISAKSQLARFDAGKTDVAELPLYAMAHNWGKPGKRALKTLAQREDAELATLITKAEDANSGWAFEREVEGGGTAELKARLADRIAVRPESAKVMPLLEDMQERALQLLDRVCVEGERNGCVFVMLPKETSKYSADVAILLARENMSSWRVVRQREQLVLLNILAYGPDGTPVSKPNNLFSQVMRGEFSFETVSREVLKVGNTVLVPFN